jgi:hypothetical protein
MHAPKILLSWETEPNYAPPIQLSPNQITLCRKSSTYSGSFFSQTKTKIDAYTPEGSYDIYEFVKEHFNDTHFDLVVVWSSSARTNHGFYNQPFNTKKFNCPTLLIAGDTHHMWRPITDLISYAKSEDFDNIATVYDKHHLHWFSSVKSAKLAWLPFLSLQVPQLIHAPTLNDSVALIGSTVSHPKRFEIQEFLKSQGVPLITGENTFEASCSIYSKCLISVNKSLNGDVNLRNAEIVLSGGLLLCDKLSSFSGFSSLFEQGVDCDTYNSHSELLDKISFYRKYTAHRSKIISNLRDRFLNENHPSVRIKQLFNWIFKDDLPFAFSPNSDPRFLKSQSTSDVLYSHRLDVYEALQEIAKWNSKFNIYFGEGIKDIFIFDAADLIDATIYADFNKDRINLLVEKLNIPINKINTEEVGFTLDNNSILAFNHDDSLPLLKINLATNF